MAAQPPASRSAIGAVTDAVMWPRAAILMQQLRDHATALALVVFNVTPLPPDAMIVFREIGVLVRPLSMPVPDEFSNPLLRWSFRSDSGKLVLSRYAPYAKLAVWGEVEWKKVVLLDDDTVVLGNIDEMATFPDNTFAPETCNNVRPERCSPKEHTITGGLNTGVIVVAPSRDRYSSMIRFVMQDVAVLLRSKDMNAVRGVEQRYLAYPEQSLLKRYWPTVMHAPIEAMVPERGGYNWQWVAANFTGKCAAKPCKVHTVHFMSRRYNARPFDCSTCSDDYVSKVKIVHFTCALKPWQRDRATWQACSQGQCATSRYEDKQCYARWALLWHAARDRICDIAHVHKVALCQSTRLTGTNL